jgi:hypothetical protein
LGVCVQGTAPSNLQLVIDAVMRTFLEAVDSDDDHDAVSTALCGSAEVLNVVGGVPLAAYMEQLLKACTEVIQEVRKNSHLSPTPILSVESELCVQRRATCANRETLNPRIN